ncbi:MAG: Nudix family hydrolase [gamma proteobacterium symbiont of Phacoides pectinatus]
MKGDAAQPVAVAVAVIQDARGRVLLSRRPEHAHQGGLWEFPGGKLEQGEGVDQALRREIKEELGLEVSAHSPLIRFVHHYPDKRVLLDVRRVTRYSGLPRGLEGQPLAWVDLEEIGRYPLPPADRPIVHALRLPRHCLITGADPSDSERFLDRLATALERGIRLVQLRAHGLATQPYQALAEAVLSMCRQRPGVAVILNGDPQLARSLGADGVHLSSRRLLACARRPLPEPFWVGASCHTAEELARANALGLDYALLSPVRATRSHPDARPLGWPAFRELVDAVSLPVYALGGVSGADTDLAQRHGGQGVAGIGAFWGG